MKLLSFWLSKIDTCKVYVLYASQTSWKHTLLAIIDFSKESVIVKCGNDVNDRKYISEFSTSVLTGYGDFKEIHDAGTNSVIIEHAKDIVSKFQETESDKLMNLHLKSMDYNYHMVDATKVSIEEIVELVNICYLNDFKGGEMKGNYYCGITNDLDIRMEAHRLNDFSIVDDKVYAWNCSTANVAAKVEAELGKLGFDIGETHTLGNGGNEASTIVYLLKKGEKVIK